MSIRPVRRIIQAKPTIEGAGVHLRRAIGFGDPMETDPFLLLDDFRSNNPEDYLAGSIPDNAVLSGDIRSSIFIF